MEFINKIELRGRVGRRDFQVYGSNKLCRFSLATDYSYRDRAGNPVIDTIWFNISYWDSKDSFDFNIIEKGAILQVWGRVRTYKIADADGQERSGWDVQARKVKLCTLTEDDNQLLPESNLM